ncbi:hypothetical protein CCP3SC1AL1_470022 [Gammaproteobacteria bacterium]
MVGNRKRNRMGRQHQRGKPNGQRIERNDQHDKRKRKDIRWGRQAMAYVETGRGGRADDPAEQQLCQHHKQRAARNRHADRWHDADGCCLWRLWHRWQPHHVE